jgi:uncharacterized membrane protein
LRSKLYGLPQNEVDEQISFYSEMIDDRVEDGMSEDEAVAQIGTVENVATQIISQTPLTTIIKERLTPKRQLKAWEITLLIVVSPIGVSLLIALCAVIVSLYAALWSVVASLCSEFVSFVALSFIGIISGFGHLFTENYPMSFFLFSVSFVCASLAIFSFYGCKAATKGAVWLSKQGILFIKRLFTKVEGKE